ncbi:unnamed protein product [Bursaphelenchus xylophilus]|uniref:(pine wood nematode) hypothetical protein n=1 Tax=Bursaphelenchus xylophilus TaxID=6326 RepID=A0A1I7S1J9_BURXY|nr:unnamed protein product [Bursaphelenchus xylophilus]CAG9081374.1 unnamed protein product [Bursaphelenchus xylophilus]
MSRSFLASIPPTLAEVSRRLNEARTNENKSDILFRKFFELLLTPGNDDELGSTFYCLELGLYLLAIPLNLAVCWAVTQTNTFHPNLRLILFSIIMCGVLQASVRSICVLNILTYEMLVPTVVVFKLIDLRAFFMNQMLLSFLNVFIERFIALKLSARYEKAPLYIGVVITACWALLLSNRWIKRHNKVVSTGSVSLSKRYQMNENIKTLRMCRPWIIFYLITNVVHALLLYAAICSFLMDGKNSVKLLMQAMDVLYAVYVAAYGLILVNGHQGLRAHFRVLLGNRSKVTVESFNYLATNLRTNNENFDGHFKRLRRAWA